MFNPSEFVVRAAQPYELPEIGMLVARAFSQPGAPTFNSIQYFMGEGLLARPEFSPALCRVGVLGEEIVAHARVEPLTLRYGSAQIKVAGLASVCTHPDHQKRGYSASVLRDALAYMAEQGTHLSLLHTRLNYYRRFGFSSVWPTYAFEVDSAEAARLAPRLKLRDARPQDIPQMAALYERHWSWRVALTRSPENWLWRFVKGGFQVMVVEDSQRHVQGYIAGYEVNAERVEVIADTPDAAATLLGEFGRRQQTAGKAHLRWIIPPDDVLVNYARQLLTVTLSARYHPDGGWMARLIDSHGLVEALLPEIIAQAQTTLPSLKARDLIFVCHPDVVEIGWRGVKTTFCQLNHQDFIQVMFGSLRPAALAVRPPGLQLDAVRLLEALFPQRVAALPGWDWF